MAALGAVTLFVGDVAAAKDWYLRVFQAPIVFEDDQSTALRLENTIVNLLARGEAVDMIAPSVVAQPGAGSVVQYTVFVDDLAATLADLAGRGVELSNGPIDRPWGQRTACVVDPDGNVWEFAQTIA